MLEVQHLIIGLVEPSRVQARIIQKVLESFGITRLEVFTTGQAALSYLRQQQAPDLIISALYLPDMTGTDLVYQMRDDENLRDLPYILISSETNPRYLDPIRQAGTIAILPKPFSPTQLKKALLTTLDILNADELRMTCDYVDIEQLNVLVVDDSFTARHYVKSVLKKIGMENITEARNGKEAVTLLERSYFDLVFTDYNMPEMDGQQLVEYIRNESMQSSVPVLMVSSEKDENRLAVVQQAGVSAICDKPFEPQTVKRIVERALATAVANW